MDLVAQQFHQNPPTSLFHDHQNLGIIASWLQGGCLHSSHHFCKCNHQKQGSPFPLHISFLKVKSLIEAPVDFF